MTLSAILVVMTLQAHRLRDFAKSTIQYVRIHAFLLVVTITTIAGSVAYFVVSPSYIENKGVVVSLGKIKQYVRVSGSVEPRIDANLSFQSTGAVSYVGVSVGDVVTRGDLLSTLQSGDAQASLLQAEANVASQQALYDQLVAGARKEEVAVKQQAYDNAEISLNQTYTTLPDSIRSIDSTMGDVLKNKLAPLFVNAGDRYQLSFTSCDAKLSSLVETGRTNVENTLGAFQKNSLLVTPLASNETVEKVFNEGYQATVEVDTLLNSVSLLLLAPCSSGNSSLDGYRASLSLVRTQMTALFASISSTKTALTLSKNTHNQSRRDLELVKAGTDSNKLRSQAALVKQAQAQVAQAYSQIEKTKIVAPFTGTISDVSVSEGETVTAGKSAVSMLTTNAYQIEAKIPEIDIVKIATGSPVSVTLDAYGKSIVFPAVVTRINPTATLEGNVPIYKVLVSFVNEDGRIRSGMTANINIETRDIQEAVVVPSRFVVFLDESTGTVNVKEGKSIVTKTVTLGVRGEDGNIEILSGLRAGEEVVAPETSSRSAQKQTK